jgi:hypothetical protein
MTVGQHPTPHLVILPTDQGSARLLPMTGSVAATAGAGTRLAVDVLAEDGMVGYNVTLVSEAALLDLPFQAVPVAVDVAAVAQVGGFGARGKTKG